MLTEFCPAGAGQADLFDMGDVDRSRNLMTALDAVNRRMGRGTLFYAGSGVRRDWKAFANMTSQHFTTDWRQVVELKV
jgi:DNA polymerase V